MLKRLIFFSIFFVSISTYSQCPVNIDSIGSVDCYGNMSGSITVSPTVPGYWTYNLQIWNSTANMWMPFGTINTNNPSYTFFNLPSDSFRVSVEDTLSSTPSTGCVSTGIFVPEPPALNPGVNATIDVCESSAIFDLFLQLNGTPDTGGVWTQNGSPTSNMFDPSVYSVGSHTLTYTVSSSPTCFATADIIVVINSTVEAGGNGTYTLCEGDSAFNLFNYLAGSPDVGGVWRDVNNNSVSNIFDPSNSGHGTFIFTYTVLAAPPCIDDTATVTIIVYPLPTVLISGTTTITQGQSTPINFTFTGSAPFSVVYDDGSGLISSTLFNSTLDTIIVTPYDTTTYTFISVADTNGCSKIINDSVTINVVVFSANYTIDSVTTINESCCGDDGRIQIHVAGIDDSLKYSIDSGQTWQDSAIFHSLSEGDYYIVVEDTNGMITSWGDVSLSSDATPNIDMSVHVTDIVCNEDSNGTFRVLYPDSCYSYVLWRYTISPPYYISVDTGTYFNALIAGSYGVIAHSNTGNCVDSSSAVIIDEPNQLMHNGISAEEVRCSNNGLCDGNITLSVAPTGGTPPYYYSILEFGNTIPQGPIVSDSSFSGICTDSFEVTLFDANACKVIDTVFVADSTLYIDSIVTSNVTCFGFADGSAILYAHGGYAPYNYTWSSGDSVAQLDSLSNMQYSVIVSDTQNCLAFDTIIIIQPNEFLFNIKVIDGFKPESCQGVSYDGEFYMNYQGGTAPFHWSWIGTSGASGSGFGDTISNLTFDTLTLFVVDANGCIGDPAWIHADSVKVDALNALNPLVLDTVISDSILCYGSETANVVIKVKSGEPFFTYSIDSGQTFISDSNFTNLAAGNYHIEVRDTFGCSVYTQIEIKQAAEIIIFNDSIKHISCYDGTDGYLSVSPQGGHLPYNYLWNPTNSINNFSHNLAAGLYTVNVTDSVGCSKIDSFLVEELTLPLVSNTVVTAHSTCYNTANGSATVSVQGGMAPYNIDWNGANNNALSAGVYIITINDSLNCGPIYDTVEILQPNPFLLQTTSVTANPCFGDALGELTFSASGGTMPYIEFYARDEQNNITMAFLPEVSGLAASNYDVWAIDANGCISDTLKSVKVGEPGKIQINVNNHINTSCFQKNDGVLDLYLISGTSPYTYVLSANSNIINQGNINQTASLIFDNLFAIQYLLSITDSNNCQKDSILEITEPNEVIADFTSEYTNGKKTFTVNLSNNSQGADIFVWDYDDGTQQILELHEMSSYTYNQQGQYEIMLIAENSYLTSDCNDTAFQIIDVQGFDVFNVFTPNDDGLNDVFKFDDWYLSSLYVEIYNRWGEKIFHWDSPNGSWDGLAYNGDKAPDGVYYFYLKANGIDGYLYEQQGSITLIR